MERTDVRGGRMGLLTRVGVVVAVVGLTALGTPLLALERNAGKYGAMFYWWYDRLPPTTVYAPTTTWSARDPAWWAAMVTAARDAGLGWLAPDCWGQGTTADPASLAPLLAAIDRVSPGLKIALFDDTTSEVLRKNEAKGHGWTVDVRFDLSDLAGLGEGGLSYFYDQQWKRFFDTVPRKYWLTIDERPVVFLWHGGFEWYDRQDAFHSLVDALRAATRRDFGVDPYVIVEESWTRLDPTARVDAAYDWFEPHRTIATLITYNGVGVGHLVPGYDCSRCDPPRAVVGRQDGAVYRAGLEAVSPSADLVLIEALDNVDENDHLVESGAWGKLYLALTKWFATNVR